MKDALREELREEIRLFHEQTQQFINKQISVKDFKGFSGGFGSYAQRGAQTFMLRLRMNQGVVTKDKLKFLCDTSEQHGVTKLHFTTCQTIQMHDLSGTEIPYIMSDALDHDIVCRGGGGDFPRNVMCSPLSGVDPDEYFDVRPYAECVGDYLLSIVNKFTLPRKLKVAFSSSDKNETHANFRDLGFCANADHTFDVYCAGGLGNNPRMGVKVGHHVQPDTILFYVSAMVLMFMEHGDYVNRAKARTRYLQDTLGVDGLVQDYQDKVEKALRGENLMVHIEEPVLKKTGDKTLSDRRVIAQKQQGLYAVYYHPLGGCLAPQKLRQIYETIKDMEDVELRITPQQGVYIINCTADEAKAVLAITEDGARNRFEESVSCIGASICQVGLRDSQGTLREAIMYFREKDYPADVLTRIFISGCTSSCGTNQIGAIGFQGTVKVIDKKPYPAFKVSLYRNEHAKDTRFGDIVGAVLADDLCLFLQAIADHVSAHGESYEAWIAHNADEMEAILKKYIK